MPCLPQLEVERIPLGCTGLTCDFANDTFTFKKQMVIRKSDVSLYEDPIRFNLISQFILPLCKLFANCITQGTHPVRILPDLKIHESDSEWPRIPLGGIQRGCIAENHIRQIPQIHNRLHHTSQTIMFTRQTKSSLHRCFRGTYFQGIQPSTIRRYDNDPAVSPPIAKGAKPAATPAAEPDEEPPIMKLPQGASFSARPSGMYGDCVCLPSADHPKGTSGAFMPQSSVRFVVAMMMTPAERSLSTRRQFRFAKVFENA